ncbi:MAG: hypothetical protein ABMA02_07145 [Saprospiraceae bacterium]
MTRFFKFSVAAFFLSAFLLAEVQGQKVTDVAYYPDGNRIVLTYNISKSWIQLPYFLRRKVWILPALEVPGLRPNFDTIKALSGDWGLLERPQPGSKIMVWDFSKDLKQLPPGSRLTVKLLTNRSIRNRVYTRYYVAGWSGTAAAPIGVSLGKYGLMGWYVDASVRNWPRSGVVASSLSAYKPPCGNCTVQFDSNPDQNDFDVAIGINQRFTKWLYFTLGMGLHQREEIIKARYYDDNFQEIGSQLVTPNSKTFLAAELGTALRFGRFFAGARIGLPLYAGDANVVPTLSLGYAFFTRQVKRY